MMQVMKLRSSRLARLDSGGGGSGVFTRPRPCLSATRSIHNTRPDHVTIVAPGAAHSPPESSASEASTARSAPALACLPLSQVLRTYLITSVSSSPALLQACFKALQMMVNSNSPLTSVEKNPIFALLLRETFYKQFCAGRTTAEVQQTMKQLREIGYSGVIIEYALEVLADATGSDPVKDIEAWRMGLLQTVDATTPGDFVGLKWSGLGPKALQLLKQHKSPTARMDDAMREVCTAAAAKNISLLPAAEETNTTPTIDAWSLNLQRDYNRQGRSVIYNTYQAYLKSTPAQLAKHLSDAKNEDYTLGIKLVRGAYLGTDLRSAIWPNIERTHAAYDGIAEALLSKKFMGLLQPLHGRDAFKYPDINLVLATHNAASVRKAITIRNKQIAEKQPLVPLAYAQLQGMADEVSCELIQAGKAVKGERDNKGENDQVDVPRVFKCTTWGTMEECLNYLLRRAGENKDAAGRTVVSRTAMGGEVKRRFKGVFGLA